MKTRVDDAAFVKSLAQRMHDLGVAVYNNTPGEVYAGDGSLELPVAMLGQLEPTPNRAVAIVLYNTDPDIDTVESSPLHFVQLAWRADTWQGALDDAANGFRALHSKAPGQWPGGVAPLWMLRTVNGKPEADNGRWIKADSYDVRLK